jgi:uncharacterized protein (DUF1499 family)
MMLRRWVLRVLTTLLVLLVLGLGVGQAGLLQGSPPTDLGVRDGRLKAPSNSPNSVSSQARLWAGHPRAEQAHIEPLALRDGDGPATLALLAQLVQAAPGAVLVDSRPDYLYAQFNTPLMKYADDVEFWWDRTQGVVQVRSASRLGQSDLGMNRQRVEVLRQRLLSAQAARP